MYEKRKEAENPQIPEFLELQVNRLLWCRRMTGQLSSAPDGALKEFVLKEIDAISGNQPSLMEDNQNTIKSLQEQLKAARDKISELYAAPACSLAESDERPVVVKSGFWKGFFTAFLLLILMLIFLASK